MKNNPPPALDTNSAFYIEHFMTLLTEARDGSLPVMTIIAYAKELGVRDINMFKDIMLSSYALYYKNVRKNLEKE